MDMPLFKNVVHRLPQRLHHLQHKVILVGFALSFCSAAVVAAPLDIAQSPLYLGGQVKPNIMMVIDDSGSMDSEVLLPTNDGALWWNTTNSSFVGLDSDNAASPGTINFNQAGTADNTWKKYVYLFPNGTGTGNRVYSDSNNDHYAVPPTIPYAWVRSPDYNGMYYNPTATYAPWISDGASTYSDITPSAATSDPKKGGATIDLTTDLASSTANWVFRMHTNMVIPKGTYYQDTSNTWVTAATDIVLNTARNVPIQYFPSTYYLKTDSGSYTTKNFIGTCNSPNAAHYVDLALYPGDFTSADVQALGPDGACLKRYEIKSGNTFPTGRSYTDELQNFANWFSYYRKRHLSLRAGAGNSFDSMVGFRVGGFPINNRTLNGMWDFDTERNSFYQWMYGVVGSGGTPNREALKAAGDIYNTNTNVITHSCQQNFTLLFTDGYSNVYTGAGVGNADGDNGSPYADNDENTIADIAMYFYENTLRSALNESNVPVSQACESASPAPWLDCNSDLHMVTFGITLGAKGHIFGNTHFNVEDAYTTPPAWATPSITRNPVQVDDLYHAAVNGRGEMLNAGNAQQLETALTSALSNILGRGISSAAAIATNSTRLDTGSYIYQARFNSADWSGQLLAYKVDTDGSVGAAEWDAADQIPEHGSRNIFTHNGTSGVEFTWGNLTSTQRSVLGADDTIQQNVVSYLRGSHVLEQRNGGAFRNRNSRLGDIVNSDPWYVSNGNFGYNVLPDPEGDAYVVFRNTTAYKNRPPMLYLGANDGMLHGFDATTGSERFAYVPRGIITSSLATLADPNYAHKYFVDGPPRAGDAYINRGGTTKWTTVLVGSTGAGGRSVFALDVTNPGSFSANNVMWEFGYADANCSTGVTACREIGTTIGQPAIVRMRNGKWAAIFGNGYNSASGKAMLFIVNLETGTLIKAIDTGVGNTTTPNGLATPLVVDVESDRMADYVYAGDLYGNMWKFDITSTHATNFNGLDVAYKLHQALDVDGNPQPITAKPAAGRHPESGLMVYFGTGKYFETGDNVIDAVQANRKVHTFYGLWDNGSLIGARTSNLLQQSIVYEDTMTFDGYTHGVRVVSNNDIGSYKGWYIDLISPPPANLGRQGEMVVATPLLWRDRVIFVTIIPDPDPCSFGGTSWLMEVDPLGGGRLDFSVFDLNKDGLFDDGEYVTLPDGTEVPVSGRRSDEGLIKTPGVISADDVAYKYTSGSSGKIEVIKNKTAGGGGRQSWQQLR